MKKSGSPSRDSKPFSKKSRRFPEWTTSIMMSRNADGTFGQGPTQALRNRRQSRGFCEWE